MPLYWSLQATICKCPHCRWRRLVIVSGQTCKCLTHRIHGRTPVLTAADVNIDLAKELCCTAHDMRRAADPKADVMHKVNAK